MKDRLIINEKIRAFSMLVIDEAGEPVGEMNRERALALAAERGLDLALMAPNARPPVAKLIDYGKYQYEQRRAQRKAQSASKQQETKGIRIGLRTGEHDIGVRINQTTEFLEKGHKVRVSLVFKGREIQHADLGFAKINAFAEKLAELARVEQNPLRQGHQIHLLLAPKK